MRILLIEDDAKVASFIKKGLEENGCEVMQAFDGATGLSLGKNNEYDVIILDVVMPEVNGVEVCKKLRKEHQVKTPIIMLTALSSTDDVVNGLEAGADDYLAKPFAFKELLWRVRALSRRKSGNITENTLKISDLIVDKSAKTVFRGQDQIDLTAKEFFLLEYFLLNKNRVISRTEILENVWDINFDLETNVVDVYVNYLRNKVDKPYKNKLIHTVIGMGYILKDENQG